MNPTPADPLPLGEYSRLLESVYQGPLETPPWKSFVEELRGLMEASFVTLILRPAAADRPSVLVLAGPSKIESVDLYDSRFYQLDPFQNLPRGRIVTADDLLGERVWLESVIYLEYLKPLDIRHILACDMVPSEPGEDCRLRVTRGHGQPAFDERDKALMALLMPHVRQSVHLCSHMGNIKLERKLFAGTVDSMQVGTVTLDEKGVILSINSEATAILDEKDGIALVGGALKADYGNENTQLQKLIQTALAGTRDASEKTVMAEAMSITRPSGRAKLGALVRIIPAEEHEDAWSRPKVAVFLRNAEQKASPSIDVIRRLFDLTHAEASLAVLLTNGLTLDEASEQLNIRRNTARAHLRSIFSKMGVTRQTELVRLVLNSVGQLG
ncbi:helix-turn-helix transcriptional regulator [Pelomonas sp. KK5]|uniref:helix-turn-helix transcriptional regulator n=1 Tax=Pelomonas sp. KK5 TaxID=1855730 RepID=UPI00097BD3FA|nr:helix-turn-helix transcriptional regulator [Pelomonas sp. KK5]